MNILSVGGSDPSSGAGIQSDLRVFSLLDCYCFTVITGITSQNTSKFIDVVPTSISSIKNQIDSILSDFQIDVIKIGMVYNSSIIRTLYNYFKTLKVPIIVDPVIKSTTGGILLEHDAMPDYKKYIVPLAHTITPNVYEAEKISGIRLKSKNDLIKIAKKILNMGAKNVIITGYKSKNMISDFIYDGEKKLEVTGKELKQENHGSGCNYSAALCYGIAKKKTIFDSGKCAKEFTINSIINSKKLGKGIAITNYQKDVQVMELINAANKFVKLKNIYKQIPECQTNFVYARKNPKSVNDILGISGRIVKAGEKAIIAGDFEYGGSRHVATAILHVGKKFPEIRSGVNIRFDEKTLKLLQKRKFNILSYDRGDEPSSVKTKENSSISWGIRAALMDARIPPDVIFHKGDYGKEAMILIFGKNPEDVINKLNSII